MGPRSVVVVAVAVAVVAAPRAARAEMEAQAQVGAHADVLANVPDVSLARPLVGGGGAAPLGRGLTSVGVEGGFGLVFDDRWVAPIFGLAVGHAVGRYPSVVSHVDGAAAVLLPATAWRIELLLPGIGLRVKARRFAASVTARFGISAVVLDARVAELGQVVDTLASAVSPNARVELAGCRRWDPLERLCLVVTPHVWDFGLMNGLTVGLRWEMGP